MPTGPRNAVTKQAMWEQIFDALTDAEWPATEAGVEKALSDANIESYERHMEFELATTRYEAACAAQDLAAVVAATANADLRRDIFAKTFRKRGTPRGSRSPIQTFHSDHARYLLGVLKTIWPTLKIPGLPKFDVHDARDIVAAFTEQRLQWPPLPPQWFKVH